MIKLEIPRIPHTPNTILRAHWRHQRRNQKLWDQEVWVALAQTGQKPLMPYARARVVIDRRSRGRLDPDNLVGSMKPVIDALRHACVIENDTADHIELVVTQSPTRRRPPRTLIEIQPLPPNVTQDGVIPTPSYEVRG
jgi:Holliday junction resolvase RusA-like endonuclease